MGSSSPVRLNDLTGLVEGVFSGPFGAPVSQPIAEPFTFAEGIQYTPLTLNRIALSYGYMGYGLVQTVIDMPVEDAFRGGIEIETDELDPEEIEELHRYMEENRDLESIKSGLKWARLYGGGGLLIETDDDNTREPLRPEKLRPDSVLRFIAADRWELLLLSTAVTDLGRVGFSQSDHPVRNDVPYIYYTIPLHRSRVIKLMGKEAPSYIRLRLQGWGMSELERCMRDINSFVKFQNVIFELIDEKKLDIFKIQQFNEALMSAEGTQLVQKRIQLNAMLKNYKNATVMDSEDDFVQKELAMTGIADIYQELRQNLAASLQMPEAKLFGQSSSGFSSGQDTIENYNAMVESGVRCSAKPVLHEVISLRCQQLFGFVPSFKTKFKPLRVLNEPEEELVLTSRLNRALSLFDRRLFTAKELLDSLDKDKLLNIQTEIQQGLREIPEVDMNGDLADADGGDDKEKKENAIVAYLRKKAENERKEFVRRDQQILKHLRRNS